MLTDNFMSFLKVQKLSDYYDVLVKTQKCASKSQHLKIIQEKMPRNKIADHWAFFYIMRGSYQDHLVYW